MNRTFSPLAALLPERTTPELSYLQVQATAQRLEDELGDEQPSFITGCPRDWAELPRPDLPLIVGLDGGYVHSSMQRTRRDGWFEVIAGKVMPHEGPATCFSYVQTYDKKPKRRLFDMLVATGCRPTSRSRSSPMGVRTSATYPCSSIHILVTTGIRTC